jgi:hypothetical protein
MRLATFDASGAEVSVAAFPGSVGGTLANVNRWRGQIGLEPATEADLPALLKTTKDGGVEVSILTMTGAKGQVMLASMISPGDGQTWFVKAVSEPAKIEEIRGSFEGFSKSFRLEGAASGSTPPPPAMPAPMPGTAGGNGMGGGMPGNPPTQSNSEIGSRLVSWPAPPTWKPQELTGGILSASFAADNAEGGAKVTASSLLGDGGGMLANINRWRGQVGLPEIGDLSQQPLETVGQGSTLVDLTNAAGTDRMLVAVISSPEATWFFKSRGTPKGVEAERNAFERMVRMIGLGANQ